LDVTGQALGPLGRGGEHKAGLRAVREGRGTQGRP